jgi:hypothetical protein
MKRQKVFGTVGRATVPAETGRHGGRPYDSTRPKFLFRFDWTLAASGAARMKLAIIGTVKRLNVEHRTSNIERQIWNRFAQSFLKWTEYIIRCWTLNVRCSMFISFSFD